VKDEAATQDAGALTSASLGKTAEQGEAGDAYQPAPAAEQAESDIAPSLEGQAPVDPEPAPPEANAEAEELKPVLLWRPARFERGPRHQHHRGHGKGHQGGSTEAGGEEHNGGHRRFGRKGKPGRFDGEGNNGQGRNGPRKGGHDGPRKGKPAFQKPREERPVRFDPDSPFAKLAALRDQLKK
jgi:ATP-dependent RNA helicase SUPV3L1/SUV3